MAAPPVLMRSMNHQHLNHSRLLTYQSCLFLLLLLLCHLWRVWRLSTLIWRFPGFLDTCPQIYRFLYRMYGTIMTCLMASNHWGVPRRIESKDEEKSQSFIQVTIWDLQFCYQIWSAWSSFGWTMCGCADVSIHLFNLKTMKSMDKAAKWALCYLMETQGVWICGKASSVCTLFIPLWRMLCEHMALNGIKF